jgi:hypothetical protein
MTSKSTAALLIAVITWMASTSLHSQTSCTAFSGCAAKQCEIENRLKLARQHGQRDRAAGLQTALDEVRAHCTQRSLATKSERDVLDLKDSVIEKGNKVAQRQQKLQKAQTHGDAGNIAHAKQRLEQAQDELQQAQRDLESAQATSHGY